MKDLIEQVKKELELEGITQEEAGELMGKSNVSINRMLSGRHSIQLQNFINLAKCAGLKVVLMKYKKREL